MKETFLAFFRDGYVTVPSLVRLRMGLGLGDPLRVEVEGSRTRVSGKIYSQREAFYCHVAQLGRVWIPKVVAEELRLKRDDPVHISVETLGE